MLECRNLSVFYGQHHALDGVSIKIEPEEIVVILGANGAGKSTLLQAIAGLVPVVEGSQIYMDGTDITHLPAHDIVDTGLALVPAGRGIFGELTVMENLLLGAFPERANHAESQNLERVLNLFPVLQERKNQIVRTMSGGEQQMVAIGRAMMSAPSILMLDEPSLGLSPLLCSELFKTLEEVRKSGVGILLVEQNAKQSLAIADRGYLLEVGRITGEDTAEQLMNDPAVQAAYLGGASNPQVATVVHKPEQAAMSSTDGAETIDIDKLVVEAGNKANARVKIDTYLNDGIDDLVAHAAKLQTNHLEASRSKPVQVEPDAARSSTSSPAGASGDLQRVLSEIERAAANALNPKPKTNGASSKNMENDADEVLPEIEVYKKPKIEVYRRVKTKSGETMMKVKGD